MMRVVFRHKWWLIALAHRQTCKSDRAYSGTYLGETGSRLPTFLVNCPLPRLPPLYCTITLPWPYSTAVTLYPRMATLDSSSPAIVRVSSIRASFITSLFLSVQRVVVVFAPMVTVGVGAYPHKEVGDYNHSYQRPRRTQSVTSFSAPHLVQLNLKLCTLASTGKSKVDLQLPQVTVRKTGSGGGGGVGGGVGSGS